LVSLRPSWDSYFLEIASVIAERSTCLRRKVGAVLVKDKRLLTTGYNGAPAGLSHCLETGCIRQQKNIPSGERHELCRGLHGEQNAIIQAALHGVSIKGADLYCTHHPCSLCAKMLVNAGVRRVILRESYPDELARDIFEEAGIEVVVSDAK
jgi:dCMP deaminase